MDALTYLKEKTRMCKSLNNNCHVCPLDIVNNGTIDLYCSDFEISFPEQAIAIVEQWSKEHPRKTYMSYMIDKFPKCDFDYDFLIDEFPCRNVMFGINGGICDRSTDSCIDCWNAPMEGE